MARYRSQITGQRLLESGKRLFTIFLALYLIFLLGRAIYLNYLVRQHLSQIEGDITFLKAENQRLNNLIAYYQTETFRELEAREKLGLKKPGETVYALPENSDEPQAGGESMRPTRPRDSEEKPNYIKWWEYLFGQR